MPGKLTIRFNSRKIDELILKYEVMTIGRSADNDLRLEDTTVSNHHARIIRKKDGLYIEDCNSTNGTLLNGTPIESARFENGDVIVLGKYTIALDEIDAEPPSIELDPTLQIGKKELEHILSRLENASKTHTESSISIDRKTLNWIAQDENGVWWGFENKPTVGLNGWIDSFDGTKILLKQDSDSNPDWRNTLQRLT